MFEEEITELLNLYELEELFEILDIEPSEVLQILLEGGHVTLPPFIERIADGY